MKDIKRLAEHLNYGQLADGSTRRRTNSPTDQLADANPSAVHAEPQQHGLYLFYSVKKQKLLLLLLTLKVPLWWTLFKPFFLNIILMYPYVTKGLRIVCLWLSILGGVDV